LIVGSAVVSIDDTNAAMHVVNLSGNCQALKRGYMLGEAQPVVVCEKLQVTSDGISQLQNDQCVKCSPKFPQQPKEMAANPLL